MYACACVVFICRWLVVTIAGFVFECGTCVYACAHRYHEVLEEKDVAIQRLREALAPLRTQNRKLAEHASAMEARMRKADAEVRGAYCLLDVGRITSLRCANDVSMIVFRWACDMPMFHVL